MDNLENRSENDQKSTEIGVSKLTSVYLPEKYKESSEILDQGESWIKSPKALYRLRDTIGASSVQILVAHALAGLSIGEGRFPTFTASRSKIAEVTGLSPRAISESFKFLSANKLISVRYTNGCSPQFTWNQVTLRTLAYGSVVPVNEVHSLQCTRFSGTSEPGATFYIELSLEFFRTSLEGNFFDKNAPDYKPYTFYKPGKRVKKGAGAMPAGSTYTQDRWEAWEDAAYRVWKEIQNQPDALTRLFFALQAKNVENVAFPYATLRHRVNDSETQHIARKRTHLGFYSDDEVRDFLKRKYKVGEL